MSSEIDKGYQISYSLSLLINVDTQIIYTTQCINVSFTYRILHITILVTHNIKIEDRRRKVTTILAQSLTETEIAHELEVDQSTISRDIKALKQLSQRFVFDLAKSDLAYCYKQCIDGIEEVRRKGWEIFKGQNNSNLAPKDKLLALKVIGECNETKFVLFKEGPINYAYKIIREETR
jgi:hypothetical protein